MRRGPEVSGWAGSLFPEPIDQVKAPSDRCICHQDCPQYETCETEALDKSSKVYYLLRCVKGKFPACANCMCMACDRCHECQDGPEMGQPGGTRYRMCNRPISITGCPDYSGTIPWVSEAVCRICDHVCDLRKDLVYALKLRCDPKATVALVPVEPTKLVDPETETIADLAKRLTQIAERDGEKILEKLYGVSVGMTAAAAVEAIKAANRELTGDNVAMFLRNEGHLGTRAQRCTAAVEIMREVGNWSEWHRTPAPVVDRKDYVDPETGIQTWCKQRQGHCLKLSCDEVHCDRVEPLPDMCYLSGTDKMREAPVVPEMPFHVGDHVRLHSMVGRVRAITDRGFIEVDFDKYNFGGSGRPEEVTLEPDVAAVVEPVTPASKPAKPKKPAKLRSADYNGNALPGSNADTCSHCDCETCGLNQAHLNYTDKEWKGCPPCGCDQCLGKPELQPTTLCGRKAALTAEVMGNTESQLPREQLHVDTVQRYVRPAECAEGSCTACQCQTCGNRNMNCALNGDEPVLICSTCWLNHPHHWKVYAAIVKKCSHWRDAATFPADILAPGMGPCPEIACQLMYNGEGGSCLCHSCKHGTPDCDSTCGVPGYPMETGQYACEWYAKKDVVTPEGPTPEFDALAAELDVQMMKTAALALSEALKPTHGQNYWDVSDLVKVGDLVTRLHARGYIYEIRKVTRVEKTDAGWQIYGDLWDDFRHPKRKKVSKNEPIIRYGVTGWKAEDGKVVPMGQKVVEDTFGAMYDETYEDECLISLTLEQVTQLVAVEEAEDVNGPTWYTHVWLKPEGSKGHKNEQGYLEDPRKRWPLLGHARFVDTSAAAVARTPSGRRSEVCQDEPECEQCHCHTCQYQKNCRLDNTLAPCSPCKTSGGAHHHKAVDCEGCTPGP